MKKRRNFFKGAVERVKGMETEMLGWWIIAIAVLVIMIIGYFVLKDKGVGAIDVIKNMFGGGVSGGGDVRGSY